MTLIDYLSYIKFSVYRAKYHIKAESARVFLGALWRFIEPVLYLGAFYLVFGIIFNQRGEDYVSFLLVGLVIWKWFASSVNASMDSIRQNMPLIYQVYIPKFVFPLSSTIASTFSFLIVFIVLTIVLAFYHNAMSIISLVNITALLILQFFFITSICMILAFITPFIPDIKFVIDSILMALFFLSGIFFKFDSIPDQYQMVFNLNPIGILIKNFRDVMIYGKNIAIDELFTTLIITCLFFVISIVLLLKYDKVYAKREFL